MARPRRDLTTALLDAIRRDTLDDWQQYGRETLARVREDSPEVYLSFVAKVLPKPQDTAYGMQVNNAIVIAWGDSDIPASRVLEHNKPAIKGTIERPTSLVIGDELDEEERN